MAIQRTEHLPGPWEEGDYLLERNAIRRVLEL